MPSVSRAQHAFMAMSRTPFGRAALKAHGHDPAPEGVAQDFMHADKGKHFPNHHVKGGKPVADKIHIKASKKGSLHKALGIKPNALIPTALLNSRLAAHNVSPAMKKKLVFAKNARGWNK